MSSKTDLARKIRKAAELDLQIKAMTTERDEVKADIKADIEDNYDTYVGEAGFTAKVERFASFNAALAQSLYGDIPEATEPKVTAASVKAYLAGKYTGKKAAKAQEKIDALYNVGSKITFGQLG